MLAIHNIQCLHFLYSSAANAFAKLSKCQQFTTIYSPKYVLVWLQTLLQSYQNVSNSQLNCRGAPTWSRCKRFCKVIKMLAIHNYILHKVNKYSAANAFAKLSKCQQFTTCEDYYYYHPLLQTLLQSYQNVSNSQPRGVSYEQSKCCKRFCKVIKMLAIHNSLTIIFKSSIAANAFAKLSKCQQFTTPPKSPITPVKLQTLLQSYQNVSNSQQNRHTATRLNSCKRFCKVIKMLAIHNCVSIQCIQWCVANAFAKLSKCQQFTTLEAGRLLKESCKRFCKVIKMLAIHNLR